MQREVSSEPAIAGAFGTIKAHDEGNRRGARARLLTLIAIIGPGLIVMVGDNDAGGVSTYAQAGQNFGYSLLWTLPLLIPVLIVIQEMVARLGAVTGVGHGRLIRERFGRYWGNLSIFSILILNFLIIVTEFIGISLSMRYFGVTPYASVPIAVLLLFAVTASGSFRSWERFMMLFIAINFVIIPLAIVSHPSFSAAASATVTPSIRGGASSASVLLIISIIGTTIAPWQLFFQESNIVDKRITPRWLNYERVDTIIGSFIVVIVASILVGVCAVGLSTHGGTGAYTNALGVARGLSRHVGHGAGTLFAILLLNASVIGAAVVTLASSYALGDLSSTHQGLNARIKEAMGFLRWLRRTARCGRRRCHYSRCATGHHYLGRASAVWSDVAEHHNHRVIARQRPRNYGSLEERSIAEHPRRRDCRCTDRAVAHPDDLHTFHLGGRVAPAHRVGGGGVRRPSGWSAHWTASRGTAASLRRRQARLAHAAIDVAGTHAVFAGSKDPDAHAKRLPLRRGCFAYCANRATRHPRNLSG